MTIGFDGLNGCVERQAAIEPPPSTGVATPLEVEAGERRVELLAEVVGKAGVVALDEAVLGAARSAEDIDGVVELGRPDLGQEARLHEVGDQVIACRDDADLFRFGD